MTGLDAFAVLWFLFLWVAYSWTTRSESPIGARSLTQKMNVYRRTWFRTAARRELRMIDTAILGGLQNGTAFFASTTIFAIGGCFALLGSTQEVVDVSRMLPFANVPDRAAVELKVVGLTAIFAYAFFKFGWAYRLFNYSSILFGAIPIAGEMQGRLKDLDAAADRAAEMNIVAASHFNAGLRAVFMSIGYLGWFAGPLPFMASSLLVISVLARRQFFSAAGTAIAHGGSESP